MAQYTFTRDGVNYLANIAPDTKNNTIPDAMTNATGTWLRTEKSGTYKVWFKNGFEDLSNQKIVVSKFTYMVLWQDDNDVISSNNYNITWSEESQYDAWYTVPSLVTNMGDDINKRLINGLLESLGHVDTETGEGYLFDPVTLLPLSLD